MNTTETSNGLKDLKVLVVEDSKDLVTVISRSIEHLGGKVITAADGQEALFKVATEQPMIIVTDILMPGMGGVDFCSEVKKRPEYRHIPIIVISRLTSVEDRIKAFRAGADYFITKPFSITELIIIIKVIRRFTQNIIDYYLTKAPDEPMEQPAAEVKDGTGVKTSIPKEVEVLIEGLSQQNNKNFETGLAHYRQKQMFQALEIWEKDLGNRTLKNPNLERLMMIVDQAFISGITRRFGSLDNIPVIPKSSREVVQELKRDEKQLADLIDGMLSIAELCEVSSFSRRRSLALLYGLAKSGVVKIRDWESNEEVLIA